MRPFECPAEPTIRSPAPNSTCRVGGGAHTTAMYRPVPGSEPLVDRRVELGRAGEEAALGLYRRRGYELVARNWRCSIGELDLVVRRGGVLVFCEVKTRRGSAFGAPFEAVHHSKQRKLRALAQAFLAQAAGAPNARFDVASVTLSRSGRAQVHVFEDAF
jgi:putative endonuclease